jgi:hypothetical protein
MKKNRTNELTKAILSLLKLRGFKAWRNNVGGFKYTYKGKTGFVRYGDPGSPDIMAIDKAGRFYGIEVKTGKDKLRPEQAAWHLDIEQRGCVSIVARSVDDVLNAIKNST